MSLVKTSYQIETEAEDKIVLEPAETDGAEVKLTFPLHVDSWDIPATVKLAPDDVDSLLNCLSLASGRGEYNG